MPGSVMESSEVQGSGVADRAAPSAGPDFVHAGSAVGAPGSAC